MTHCNHKPIGDRLPGKTAGRVSMISILAISVGMAAAPANAQDMTAPGTPASEMPVRVAPVLSPQAAPAPPATIEAPSASSLPAAGADTLSPVTPDRADDLARKGGFNAETVAPEALAQIEREQQERKAAAAKAAAEAKAGAQPVTARAATSSAPVNDVAAGAIAPPADFDRPTGLAESAAASTAAIPVTEPAPEIAVPPADVSSAPDWNLLAALAALLGIGGAGAYAVSRRRKSKGQTVAGTHSSDPLPASLNAAIMPELRRDPVETEIRPAAQAPERSAARAEMTEFVGGLPVFDTPRAKADRNVKIAERRVAAAPRPYLGAADLSRREGYFTDHVDAMPTPQNPFLTRQKRIKRARFLDGKLAEMKASMNESRTRIAGEMKVSRPLEPAFS